MQRERTQARIVKNGGPHCCGTTNAKQGRNRHAEIAEFRVVGVSLEPVNFAALVNLGFRTQSHQVVCCAW